MSFWWAPGILVGIWHLSGFAHGVIETTWHLCAHAFQASSFCLRAICGRSHFGSKAAADDQHGHPNLSLKFEGARQASSPSLCASVRAVPWADEAEQQLSRLALSGCKLSSDFRILGSGLTEAPCTDPQSYVRSLKWQDKQAARSPSASASTRTKLGGGRRPLYTRPAAPEPTAGPGPVAPWRCCPGRPSGPPTLVLSMGCGPSPARATQSRQPPGRQSSGTGVERAAT